MNDDDKSFSALLRSDVLAGLNPVEQVKVAKEMTKEWQESVRAKAIFKVVVRDDDGAIIGSSPIIFDGSSFVAVDDVYRGEKKMYEAGKRYSSPGDTWFNVLRIKREEGEEA